MFVAADPKAEILQYYFLPTHHRNIPQIQQSRPMHMHHDNKKFLLAIRLGATLPLHQAEVYQCKGRGLPSG